MKSLSICLTLIVLVSCLPGNVCGLATEDFGNAPTSELNYTDWPGIMPVVNHASRVYHWWCNGNEQFYYRGDTAALNDALKKFAAAKANVHEVLLQPGSGVAHSFDSTKTIPYNWNLHIIGGIARQHKKTPQGNQTANEFPTMAVCVGGDIVLDKIEIPAGVSVIDLEELSRRCRETLASKDPTVRGRGAGESAGIDPFSDENLAAVAKLLKDKDPWVQQNAVGAVARFGKKAEPLLPTLREMLTTQNKQLKESLEKTIRQIQQAKDTSADEKEHRLLQEKIHKFCKARKR
jgi:hypothetical protein